jgi:hypothetical protein
MTRSELLAEPLMTPLTVMPLVPPARVSVVPFLLRAPERVRAPPVLRMVPVPLVTVMARSSVAAEPL